MNASEFLFPKDLEVTQVQFKNVLFIGSCLSEAYCGYFRRENSNLNIEHILFNNAADLPEKSEDNIRSYDFQYIQLPLRSILSDGFIRQNDSANVSQDWLSFAKASINLMLEKSLAYNKKCGILTIISNFLIPQGITSASLDRKSSSDDICFIVERLNNYLYEYASSLNNVYIADVNSVASSIGKRYFLDDTLTFNTHGSMIYSDWAAHERYPHWTAPEPGRIDPLPDLDEVFPNKTYEFFDAVFRQMEAIYRTVNQIDMVKLVVFDLDNTMWRGQLVEHYKAGERWPHFDGWPLGIWEAVQILKRRGIMVSIASKNDDNYVKLHWQDAVPLNFVKYEDFIVPKINWNPKAENIREIIQQLSLTPKSVVFVDDNPVERESVAAQIPGIRVMGSNPFLTRRILLWSPETQVAKISNESMRREEMLKAQVARESDKSNMSRDDFLRSLGTEVDIWKVNSISDKSFSRIFELVNKTNQFNTTGQRWSIDAFLEFFSTGGELYAFKVRDRFTDYGIVGIVFSKYESIEQFVMSCRVLGMDIEKTVLSFIVAKIRDAYPNHIVKAKLIETESNTPCRNLYPEFGFHCSDGVYILPYEAKLFEGNVSVSLI